MGEKPTSVLDEIRKALREGGNGSGQMPTELFFVPVDGVKVVRFLSELDEPVKVLMHDKWKVMMPQPCLKYYGKNCPFHGGDGYKSVTHYAWTVWDYEQEDKKILECKVGGFSPVEDLLEIRDKNGTIKDRDVKISRTPTNKPNQSKYKAREATGEPTEYVGKKKNPFSEEKVMKVLAGLIRTHSETEGAVDPNEDPEGD